MGNTCASSHIIMYGPREVLLPKTIQAISRAYTALGYERTQKPVGGGKHIVLLAPAEQRYVSIFDSGNAHMDDGELKDVALKASKSTGSAAVFTSLYDSDTYEFVVFSNGRQVDCLMEDADANVSILKQMKPALRSKNWTSYFARPIKSEDVEKAAANNSAFADFTLRALSQLIGLSQGQSQMQYVDVKDNTDDNVRHLFFKRKEQIQTVVADGQSSFSLTYDPFYTRMISAFPASWPIEIGAEVSPTWLLLSNAAGFADATIDVTVEGPSGLSLERIFANGCKFHNGQIVGALETTPPPPAAATEEQLVAYSQEVVNAKNFEICELDGATENIRTYRAAARNLNIPNKTPQRTTQILVVVQLHVQAKNAGDWTLQISLQPTGMESYRLPKVRFQTVNKKWVPVISGLNNKTHYETADLHENKTHFNNNILSEMRADQDRSTKNIRLDHPAYTSNVAITRRNQTSLDRGKTYLEDWLKSLSASHPDTQLKVQTERQMTAAGNVSKTKKTIALKELLGSKAWEKMFVVESNYQTVKIDIFANEFDHPIAGIGVQFGFEKEEEEKPKLQVFGSEPNQPIAGTDAQFGFEKKESKLERQDRGLAKTLEKMRGHQVPHKSIDPTVHLYNWIINHPWCHTRFNASPEQMNQALDQFAGNDQQLLQSWHFSSTWLTVFDDAGEYRRTLYEESGVLNWFRGILPEDSCSLHTLKMSEGWCENVLRMVAPHMWLCKNLIEQIDLKALAKVATVSENNGVFKIELKKECDLDDLELALLPILPVESARITLRS